MDPLVTFLWATAFASLGGALFCLYIRRQVRAVVGATRHASRPVSWPRRLTGLALVVALSVVWAYDDSRAVVPNSMYAVAARRSPSRNVPTSAGGRLLRMVVATVVTSSKVRSSTT